MPPATRVSRILKKCFKQFKTEGAGPDGVRLIARLEDWKGSGNPALSPAGSHH